MKFSVLIPYKADFNRRDLLWSYVLKRYKHLAPHLELCFGVHQNEPFCKAKAINEAAKKASGDIFIVADADVVFDISLIDQVSALINKHPWIIPFRFGLRMTPGATERLLMEELSPTIRVNPADIEERVETAGALMNVMTRTCFETVAGFDERFQGWGGEDEAFVMALDTLYGPHYRLESDIYHLWHPGAGPNHAYYLDNLQLYQRYQAASGNPAQMRQLIQERFGKEIIPF